MVGGDICYIAPGVYREIAAAAKSGGGSYTTGTCAVTNGSKTVTGTSTLWNTSSNAIAGGQFQVQQIAHGTDGVTNGTGTFTSTTGNFQSGMIGMAIRINTKGQYVISAVGSTTSISIVDGHGTAGAPTTATTLTYDVGPERPYNIATVDSDTQITLDVPWSGPTLTTLAYQTWKDIKFIGDVTGTFTDGVGGMVRITGSTTDLVSARNTCINIGAFNFRTYRGFSLDTPNNGCYAVGAGTNNILEDSFAYFGPNGGVIQFTTATKNTVRRCVVIGDAQNRQGIYFNGGSTVDNSANLVENCIVVSSGGACIGATRVGGILVRNCLCVSGGKGVQVLTTIPVLGQGIQVLNSIFQGMGSAGVTALTTADNLVEDYNAFFNNLADRTLALVGTHSISEPILYMGPILFSGLKLPERDLLSFWQNNEYSAPRGVAGLNPPPDDLFGMLRPTTAAKVSWGPIQYVDWARSSTQAHAGTYSGKLADAGRVQIIVPTTNVSTTFSVYVWSETSYTGTKPQMIIKQPGVADTVITDTGATVAWNQLTTTLTPAAAPGYVVVELVSNNTASGASIGTYFDDLTVT